MQMMAAHRTKDRARDDGWKKDFTDDFHGFFHFLWPGSRSDDAFSSWWWNQRTKKGVYFSTSNSEHISTPWCLSKLVIWNAIAKKKTKKTLWIVLYRAINSVVLVANLDHCKQGLFWNLIWKLESSILYCSEIRVISLWEMFVGHLHDNWYKST